MSGLKILLALDVSGSINIESALKQVQSVLDKINPEAEVTFSTFDYFGLNYISRENFMGGNFPGGAGTTLKYVLDVCDQYDYTYVITDGYIDDLDKLPHYSEVILLED